MRIGYGAQNEDCEVRDNVIARGALSIQKFKKAVEQRNVKRLPDRMAVLIPNKYDPNRAHLVVFNGSKAREVQVEVASFLQPGDVFRLMNPKNFFGKPVLEGKCVGPTIAVRMKGEFAPFVVLKERGSP